jgi:hypothetical protein
MSIDPKHAKPESSDSRPATFLDCQCVLITDGRGNVIGRRTWEPECPKHGVKARVKAGLWPQSLADLWYKARATQPIR